MGRDHLGNLRGGGSMDLTRIHLHWTAGGHKPSTLDLSHYHFVVDGAGKEHKGKLPPEANLNTGDGEYVAHTLGANTGAIGISMCCMAGAQERPFKWGVAPMTDEQVMGLCRLAARLAKQYGIPCTRRTILTHAEVQPTLGIKQRGKWDITVLPGMSAPGDPIEVGDRLRKIIADIMK
jgi:hypothetical protein